MSKRQSIERRSILRRVRLVAWIVLVAALSAGQLVAIFIPVAHANELCAGLLLALFALLWTTPGDAIRLTRRYSEIAVFSTALILCACRAWRCEFGETFFQISNVVVLLAAGAAALWLLCRFDRSAWWAALILWNPVAVFGLTKPAFTGAQAGMLLLPICAAVVVRCRPVTERRR